MPEKKSLRSRLRAKLGRDFVSWQPIAGMRTLFLKDIAEDLQVGLVIQEARKKTVRAELVDIGARIPSVEDIYDQYEIHAMLDMGFRNPEPTTWLTLWRPSYPSVELEEHGLANDAVVEELMLFADRVAQDPSTFRANTLDFLKDARRPDWATWPGSTFLIIRALIARTLLDPDSDACAQVDELLKNEPVVEGYKVNLENFCSWLHQFKSGVKTNP